jgi:carboxyl-terminal processing protease
MIDPMTGKSRALTAVLIIGVLVVVGALYLAARAVHPPASAQTLSVDTAIAAAHGGSLTENGVPSIDLFDRAISRLDTVYYKPFPPQTPFKGEHSALVDFLRAKHVAHPDVPTQTATGDPLQDAQRLNEVVSAVDKRYRKTLGSSASSDLTQAALMGVMDSVDDPYTVYLTPQQNQALTESLNGGDFGGIGVYIYHLRDGGVILQPIDGAPAAQAGMKPGEIVDSVDGKPVKGVVLDRVEQWIRGAAGTQVTLVTHPYNAPKIRHRFTITRQIIHVPTVFKKMEDGFDYIRLSDFGSTSADEVKKALLWGHAHHAKGYIFDLRDNGGGFVDAAVRISSYFIPQGTIVSTIDRQGHREVQEALGTAIGDTQPLVVLVNKYTASASEITAGALQDYHLAKIIGTKTFGKGVVQSIYDMPDGGAIKITTARYVTPLGRDIQHRGITPDIVVPQNVDIPLDSPADKQLAAAKTELHEMLKQ